MAMFEGAVNITINDGTFIATSNARGHLNSSASNDIVDILHARSATAGLLDAAERFDAPKCDEGTRVSMLLAMKKFVQQGGRSSLFWLHGPAGIGKSALAQSLALSLKDEGDHAASFFFSRTAPGRNDGNQLIVTLACQLALNIPAIKPLLAKVVRKNPLILNATNSIKMQSLIVDPINELHKMYSWKLRLWSRRIVKRKPHPRLILVDGLDECNDPAVQRDLILCIALAARQLSFPFQFIITSRPESHILATFELDLIFQGTDSVKLSEKNLGDDEDADEQITTFLLKEFAEIRRTHPIREFLPQPWPLPGQIAQLVSKSSKGFIYPATVVRYIRMVNNRPDECLERILGLSEVPVRDKPYEPLDILYRHIFESVPDVNKAAIREIFHILVAPTRSGVFTKPRLIEDYFKYKGGHVQHVLRDLLCLVAYTNNDEPVKLLHASLPDFLLDQLRAGPLYIDIGDAHAAVAAILSMTNSDHCGFYPFYELGPHYTEFLEHIMQANTSSMLDQYKLVHMDFTLQYMNLSVKPYKVLNDMINLENIVFLVAYLLVLLIKNVQHENFEWQITEIKAYILRKSPFSFYQLSQCTPSMASLRKASRNRMSLTSYLHAVRHMLFPTMIPLLCKWTSSTVGHGYLDYIFAYEVPPSQSEIREEIFLLYLLMLASFFDIAVDEDDYSQSLSLQHHAQQPTNYSSHISCKLLESFPRQHFFPGLNILAIDLLRLSLPHADYSVSLVTLLEKHLSAEKAVYKNTASPFLQLGQTAIDYLDRVYSEAPVWSQLQVQELNNEWRVFFLSISG